MKNGFVASTVFARLAVAGVDAQNLPPAPVPATSPPATGNAPPPPPPLLPPASGFSQLPVPPPPLPPPTAMPLPPPMALDPYGLSRPTYDPSYHEGDRQAYVSLDYFLWWIKSGPLPAPIVTTGSLNDAMPGALGQPNTTVLFGNQNIDYGSLSGGRITAGYWFPQLPWFGIEGSYYGVASRTINYGAFSDDNGNPLLARSVINAQTGAESAYVTAAPNFVSGGTAVTSSTDLESFEFNLAGNLVHRANLDFDVLLGFRTLSLREDLDITDSFTPLASNIFTFQGAPVNPPNSLADYDSFHTTNHFYGGQVVRPVDVGHRPLRHHHQRQARRRRDGADRQHLRGLHAVPIGAAPVTVPGGILAQQSNIGQFSRNQFSLVPEGSLALGYSVTNWLHLSVGYNFLYWTNVLRPGNQIDRAVNGSQVPTDASFGTGGGPDRPGVVLQSSNIWRRA